MPRNKDIHKVLVIGSGPIIIGQAAEFDYAGTQACRSLKEEGMEVVLLNSNPATIMTDKDIADKVYIEPLTVEVVEQLILKEKPDSVLPTSFNRSRIFFPKSSFPTPEMIDALCPSLAAVLTKIPGAPLGNGPLKYFPVSYNCTSSSARMISTSSSPIITISAISVPLIR